MLKNNTLTLIINIKQVILQSVAMFLPPNRNLADILLDVLYQLDFK